MIWEQFAKSRKLSVKVCKTWFDSKRSHIRCKGLSKSSVFKSQARGASASAFTAHNISRASTDTDSMEISMRLTDTMLQPQQVTSLTVASGCSSVDQQVMDQFTQMRSMLSSFLGQETTMRTAFCNYLASEVEGLVKKDFQTFKNEAVKFLSNIQSKAEEGGCQPQQPQQQSLPCSSSAVSRFVPQTFQQPQQPALVAREYILTFPEAQMPSSKVVQPTQQSQVASK